MIYYLLNYLLNYIEYLIEHYPYALYFVAFLEGILCGNTLFGIIIIYAYPNLIKVTELALIIFISTVFISSLSFKYSGYIKNIINEFKNDELTQIKEYIKKYSSLLLLFFRFLPIPFSVFLVPSIIAYSEINFSYFFILNMVGSILWASTLTILFCIIGKSLGNYLFIPCLIIIIVLLYKYIKSLL